MSRNQSYCFLGIITAIYFIFCLLPLPNTIASPTRSLCSGDQRDALLEVQKEFPIHSSDEQLVTTTSWNKSVDCCSWDGVTCDDLGNSSLFNFQHLRELDLSDCRLQGEIPSSFGNLFHLTHLDLSDNQLVEEVPASIGNLNQLESLDLSDNNLIGNIPTSFSNLTKLSELHLNGNHFTGGDIILSNLTSLTIINLSFNHFKSSIFADMSGLHHLERFLGNDNSFVGPFPSPLLMISSLLEIYLSQNQFEGPIDFGNTSSSSMLRYLDLSHNSFGGRVPKSISKLVNLEGLVLNHNNFRGRIPKSISRLVNLTYLDISYNKLDGQVPPLSCLQRSSHTSQVRLSHNSFTSFSKSMEVVDGASILELDLNSNSLQGPIPQWICKLRNLNVFDLSNNHYTGSVPQCLKSFRFEEFNLRNNSLSGFLPDLFINGCWLLSFDVSRNNFEGKLPKSLINCVYLEFLNVGGNKIKDTFPFWLGSSLQSLKVMGLGSNAFYGTIYNPSAYLGFPRMRIIDISNNNFVGSLPQDYLVNWTAMSMVFQRGFEMKYMESDFSAYRSIDLVYKGVDTNFDKIFVDFKLLDFSGNQFYGRIPESIGVLSELGLLNFSGNAFTGNIPPSLANITKLETLDLSRNNLSGKIPQELGKLSFLSNINLSHNHLEGLVPESIQFESQNCSSFAGNPGLDILIFCPVPVPTSQPPEELLSEPEEPVLNWILAAVGFGPGVFCGVVIGHIFTSYKYMWFSAS